MSIKHFLVVNVSSDVKVSKIKINKLRLLEVNVVTDLESTWAAYVVSSCKKTAKFIKSINIGAYIINENWIEETITNN